MLRHLTMDTWLAFKWESVSIHNLFSWALPNLPAKVKNHKFCKLAILNCRVYSPVRKSRRKYFFLIYSLVGRARERKKIGCHSSLFLLKLAKIVLALLAKATNYLIIAVLLQLFFFFFLWWGGLGFFLTWEKQINIFKDKSQWLQINSCPPFFNSPFLLICTVISVRFLKINLGISSFGVLDGLPFHFPFLMYLLLTEFPLNGYM